MNRTILIYVIFAITVCRTLPQESKNNEFINSGIVVQDSDHDIIPFNISISEEELTELRRRIITTRWPDKETVNDHSQGIPLEKLKGLLQYWGSEYEWRKVETKLNAYPQ